MKFTIKHDVPGRIRVHMDASGMTFTQADTLQYYLKNLQGVTNAKVYERTADAVVEYRCSRKTVIEAIAKFRYSNVEVPEDVLATSGRAINSHYTEKLADQVLWRMTKKLFIPAPVCAVLTTVSSMKYIYKGIRTLLARKLEVPVLDATAIGVSILRRDFNTAGSVMFLLGIGEIIEDWTHKKSVDDLARTMSLNVNKVWLKTDDAEVQLQWMLLRLLTKLRPVRSSTVSTRPISSTAPSVRLPSVLKSSLKTSTLSLALLSRLVLQLLRVSTSRAVLLLPQWAPASRSIPLSSANYQ